jgi:hypothetical protein
MGLASPISGDWRPVGRGNSLELVAVLSVNTPGFLRKVETGLTGQPLAMVASLSVADDLPTAVPWSLDDLRTVMREVLAEDRAAIATATVTAAVDTVSPISVDEAPTLSPNERMSQLIGTGEFTHAETIVCPVPPSATDRMGDLIAECNGRVHDAAWIADRVDTDRLLAKDSGKGKAKREKPAQKP